VTIPPTRGTWRRRFRGEGMGRQPAPMQPVTGEPCFRSPALRSCSDSRRCQFQWPGIVAETLEFRAASKGYSTGGTVHIIANNQLGYTTPPEEAPSTLSRATLRADSRSRSFHVNADIPKPTSKSRGWSFEYRPVPPRGFLIGPGGAYRPHGP